MVKVTNISDEIATFSGHPPFAPKESRDVSPEQAERLSGSHLMAVESEDVKPADKKANKNFKGVE